MGGRAGGGLAEAARRDRGFGRAGRRRSRDRVVSFSGMPLRGLHRVCATRAGEGVEPGSERISSR